MTRRRNMSTKIRTVVPFAITLVIVLSIVLFGCAPTPAPTPVPEEPTPTPVPEEPTPTPVPEEAEPIIIGGVFNQTGWMATYDDPPRHGARAAVKKLNDEGGIMGRPVELLEIDGKTDPAVVANAAIQLMEQDADFIMAPCDFDIGAPACIEAQKKGLACMSTCASSPLFNETVIGDLAFTLSEGSHGIGAVTAQMAWEFGWRKAYVITDLGWEYTRSLGGGFKWSWEKMGGEIVGEDGYQPGDEDFSAQIARVKALDEPPDVILVACVMPEGPTLMRQFRLAGIEIPLIADDGIDDPEIIPAIGPENVYNIWYTTHAWFTPDAGPEYPEYLKYHEEVWGEPPSTGLAAQGWDVVMLFAKAAERAGTTEGKAVAQEFEKMTKEPTLSGYVTWTPDNHVPTKPMVAIEVKGEEFKFLRWIEPPFMPPRDMFTK
jgi:branched-chain amino acid transport system substrate-binding protein